MEPLDLQPWIEDCIDGLEPHVGERIIQLGAHPWSLTIILGHAVGDSGRVLVLEPDRDRAERCAARCRDRGVTKKDVRRVEVVHASVGDGPSVGRHDAVVGSLEAADQRVAVAALVHRCLRPGGRFVLDLPARDPCALLEDAWRHIGGDESTLDRWRSAGEVDALVETFRERGLRGVEGHVATHVVRAEHPRDLAAWFAARLDVVDVDVLDSLAIALTERLGGTGPCDAMVHRARIRGFL
jgi:SAM-dependent methyltransferase